MSVFLLNVLAAIFALVVLLGLWTGVHLLAQRRFGARHLGCSGPVLDEEGNQVCCHTGKACDKAAETDEE